MSTSTVVALFSKMALTGQRVAMVDMVFLVLLQHFHIYRRGGWSQSLPLKIFFSCSLGGGGRYFSVPSKSRKPRKSRKQRESGVQTTGSPNNGFRYARRNPPNIPKHPKSTAFTRTFSKSSRELFKSLLPCDTSQESSGYCPEKLVQMNLFILGGFFRMDFLL